MLGSTSLGGCGNSLGSLGEAIAAASKLFHIIEREPKTDVENGIKPNQPLQGKIEFKNIYFSYPSRPDIEILKDISFECKPGQTVALIDASGSGKSTIIQFLERYYDISDGEILIDKRNIKDYDIHWLRSQIGIVSQEPILFDTIIAENISICHPNATQ